MLIACLPQVVAIAQSDQHYTMFMYNKLLYNPAYAGSRELVSADADYRDQWDGIPGAPKTANITIDGLLGSYMEPFRKMALGFSLTNEILGVEHNTDMKAYYAFRIPMKHSVCSMGLSGGFDLYSANYGQLNLYQPNDPNFAYNISDALLPNFGAGVYWYRDDAYLGLSVPNLLQDAYDKKEVMVHNRIAEQIRGWYLSGGYVLPVNEHIKLEPQCMVRYAGGGGYGLPVNADINLSVLYNDRLLLGATYRTDKSIEAVVHMQVTARVNVGYAYDYLLSGLNGYSGGTHEVVVGYNFVRDQSRYLTPRFIKNF